VSSFMRNIDASDWLKNPELEVVQTSKNAGPGSSFTLTAEEVPSTPAADDGSGEAKGKKGGRNGKVMASNGGRQ
jgi:Tfp pilus assembly protein PilN